MHKLIRTRFRKVESDSGGQGTEQFCVVIGFLDRSQRNVRGLIFSEQKALRHHHMHRLSLKQKLWFAPLSLSLSGFQVSQIIGFQMEASCLRLKVETGNTKMDKGKKKEEKGKTSHVTPHPCFCFVDFPSSTKKGRGENYSLPKKQRSRVLLLSTQTLHTFVGASTIACKAQTNNLSKARRKVSRN